jgi:hypothetical protein
MNIPGLSPTPKKASIAIPSLRSRSPDYARLVDQRDEIGAQRQAAMAELAELRRSTPPHDPTPPEDPANARVDELLGRSPRRLDEGSLAKLQALSQGITDLTLAIGILDREIIAQRAKVSAVIRSEIEPEYRRRVAEVFKALGPAFEANRALEELTDALDAESILWGAMQIHPPRFLRSSRNAYSDYAIAMREAVKDGVIAKPDLPKGLPLS